MQTLWSCRVLANWKDWDTYPNFQVHKSLNYLFYWTVAIALHRYGREGFSPSMGLGNYPVARCFHYSLPSLYTYWKTGAISILFGMFGWLVTHLVWINESSSMWVFLIVGLACISTIFYANVFGQQNYNALGWLFFPLVIYGMLNGHWPLQAIALLLASFGSFTVVVLGAILSTIHAINIANIGPILAVLPAVAKLLTHFIPLIRQSISANTMLNVAKAIGMTKRDAKYKRNNPGTVNVSLIYFLIIFGQFFMTSYLFDHNFSVLLLAGITILILNSTLIRFADRQSMQMLIISIITAVMLKSQNLWLIPSYWIAISPLPIMVGFPSIDGVFSVVPKLAPYSINNLKSKMEKFLAPVRPGERVLMAFDDPDGDYNKIFDGYRVLLELPLYAAAIRNIHLMPDWWGVVELNYEGAPDFWGRDVRSVLKNTQQWNADYAIIYQEAGTPIDPKWEDNGFKVINSFSWFDCDRELRGVKPYSGQTPCWWLLKIPERLDGE